MSSFGNALPIKNGAKELWKQKSLYSIPSKTQ